jgi:hypothetical protein
MTDQPLFSFKDVRGALLLDQDEFFARSEQWPAALFVIAWCTGCPTKVDEKGVWCYTPWHVEQGTIWAHWHAPWTPPHRSAIGVELVEGQDGEVRPVVDPVLLHSCGWTRVERGLERRLLIYSDDASSMPCAECHAWRHA